MPTTANEPQPWGTDFASTCRQPHRRIRGGGAWRRVDIPARRGPCGHSGHRRATSRCPRSTPARAAAKPSGSAGRGGRILQRCAGVLEAGQRGSHHVSVSEREGLGSFTLGVGQCRALMGSTGRAVATRLATSAAERGQRAAQQRRLSSAVDNRRPKPLPVVVVGTTYRPPVLSS
jgi:hypothetical protein